MIGSDRSDFVEQALASLRDAAVPDGPPAQLLDVTDSRLRSLETARSVGPLVSTRSLQRRMARYVAVPAVVALVAAGLFWAGFIGRTATIAFADVQAQVQKVRSVQYRESRVNRAGLHEKQLGPMKDSGHSPSRYLVLGRYLRRSEWLDANGQLESWQIVDAKTGKCVSVEPKWKRFVILNSEVTIGSETGKKTERPIHPVPQADFYSLIHDVPAGATKRLPARLLDGKRVIGFLWEKKIERNKNRETWKRTWWIDPDTKLPVRVEVSYVSVGDQGVVASDWVQSDFVFDNELPESLFSTEPPEGYSIHSEKIYDYRPR